jgi:hypothetical protein
MVDVAAGDPILASMFTPIATSYEDTSINAGAALSWFSGSPNSSVTFVAPFSGRVMIASSCFVDTGAITSATNFASGWRLHEGTGSGGTQVQAESLFARGVRYPVYTTQPGPAWGPPVWYTATNLVAGATYWVEWRGQQLSTAGGLTVVRGRRIVVVPVN